MPKKLTGTHQSLIIALILVLCAGSTIWASSQPGGATPQEVFDRFTAAAEAGNWEEVAACLSPEGLTQMSAMMVAMGGMMVAFAQMGESMAEGMGEPDQAKAASTEVNSLEKKFEDLLGRHGIDTKSMEEGSGDDEELPAAFSSPAFFADVMRFIDELPSDDESDSSGGSFNSPKGKLENVVIEGDRATGTVGGEPGGFVRVGGRWYFDLDMGMKDGPSAMEPEKEKVH